MIVAIHQPDYIPYIGYFYKIAHSDVFAFLDDAQFSNDNMHHWNRIKAPEGIQRLKIPLEYHFGSPIYKVRTKEELGWKQKHLKALELYYAKAKYFKDYYPKFKEVLLSSYSNLADMNIEMNVFIAGEFGIMKQYIRTSDLKLESAREDKVIEVCQLLKGTEYLSGKGAMTYQREEHFKNKGIKLSYTDYEAFIYTQLWKEFIPNLSVIDYILNCGFDWEGVERAVKRRKEN